jgi:endoglucanase
MKKTLNRFLMTLGILVTLSSSLNAQTAVKNFLSTSGNKLYDASGKEVRLTGLNWFGFETAQFKPHGLWSRDMKSVLKQIKDLKFNCVRIPWTDAMLNPGVTIQIDSYGTDPYSGISPMNGDIKDIKSPLLLLDQLVKYCQELNLKVILDNHARIADGYLGETIWYSSVVPEAKWIENWVFLANRYKDYDAVIGLDLDNEPHGKVPGSPQTATWGNSNPATDWNKAVERCGNAILAVNPNVLIVAEGIELYGSDSYWWGGNLIGAKTHPIVLSKPNKLIYSPHEYGPTVYGQPWFEDATFPANMPGIWDKYFGYLYNENKSPLLVGEFGIKTLGGKDEIWIKKFLTYMGAKYSWTFWCFNPNSGDTGGIVGDDWSTLVQWKYDLLKPYLAAEIPNGSVTTPTSSIITATAGANGSISPTGAVSVVNGTNKTFTITPNSGYQINTVTVNGSSVGAVGTYTFTNVTANQTIAATFKLPIAGTSTITASAGANGTISPTGAVIVANGTNRTFTITPNAGYQINTVTVNGASVGAVASYTFTNVTSNQTIAATFKVVVVGGNCLLARFGVPRTTALPDKNASYSKVYTLGTAAPNLSNVTNAVINWSLANNGLWQLSFNTSNGVPTWWLDMRNSVQNFAQAQPAITFNGTGIANLDGNKYYINYVDTTNVVFVEVTGKHAIYFSNSTTAPAGCTNARLADSVGDENDIKMYPNPASNFVKLNFATNIAIKQMIVTDISGRVVLQKELETASTEEFVNISKLPAGLYTITFTSDAKIWTKKMIKE